MANCLFYWLALFFVAPFFFISAPTSPVVIEMGGSKIELTIDDGPFDLPASEIVKWVSAAADNVSTYYGHFPVKTVRVVVHSAPGRRGVSHGTTFGWGGPHIRISVGEHTTERQLNDDWMMTHEFVHLAFPDVAEEHHWIEEGIATYVEPVARVESGRLTAEQVWKSFVEDMPKGEPKDGDRGLDNTPTWGRTYWGGALFCLVADVRIREATSNRLGLQDALRAVLKESGGIASQWRLVDAFEVGDKATRTKVLSTLYAEMKDKPVTVALADLWVRLGVEMQGGQVVFRDSAPLAKLRQSITGALSSRIAERSQVK